MIEEVLALLQERQIVRAVIIDDAYDAKPHVGDIEDQRWDRFFDDLSVEDEQLIVGKFGQERYDALDVAELRREQSFVDVVWDARGEVRTASELFAEFVRSQERKREELEPLRQLLQRDLRLQCSTGGRDGSGAADNAEIIFLDLLLGYVEGPAAVGQAIARVKALLTGRRQRPPTVVLLSASPRLEELGPSLRDEAELLGCQFRMMRKVHLSDSARVLEQLYDLAVSYPDALRLNEFLMAWNEALDRAKGKFLQSIRSLDLADYANMQSLILEAEGEPVGDYVLDLYDLHLHSVLESDSALIRAAKALNQIEWMEYPPAQFMPSPQALEMMDGAQFHNHVRTVTEAEIDNDPSRVRFGDVFLAPAQGAPNRAGEPAGEPPIRYAYVVLSQPCDLQHGEVDRLLLIRGSVQPYSVKQHDEKAAHRTPIMKVGEESFAVTWDILAPETWMLEELSQRVAGGYRLVRRFRTPFALHLQQAFIGRLGRVGTMVGLPARYAASVRIFLRLCSGDARLLTECQADGDDAACLVGRSTKGPMEWLLLSDRLRSDLRRTLQETPAQDLPAGGAARVADVRDKVAFYRSLRRGLILRRDKQTGSRPLANTGHDIVQIVSGRTIEAGRPIAANLGPLVFEVEVS